MLYIGIDVAKRSHVAAAMGDGGEVVVEPFEFKNSQTGFERLLARLARRGISAGGSLVGCVSSSSFEQNVQWPLSSMCTGCARIF